MPTSSQVSVALDLLESVATKPSVIPQRLLERATQIVDDALSTPMWNGKDGAGGAAYGQIPQVDDATAAKLEAFDKIARLLFCDETGSAGVVWATYKFDEGMTSADVQALIDIVSPHVPELTPR